MSPATRRVLQIVGLALLLTGMALFGYGVAHFGDSSGIKMGEPGWFEAENDQAQRNSMFFLFGMLVIVVGGVLTSLGFRKPMSELAATDTSIAVEHSSTAMGRGLARGLHEAGGLSRGRDIVKVKCRACGFLESEDAKFCSQCSKKM